MKGQIMITNSKVYDFLKWFALVCLPSLVIAIPQLFEVWSIPYGDEIGKTLQIVAVLLGALLGVSNINYTKEQEYQGEE